MFHFKVDFTAIADEFRHSTIWNIKFEWTYITNYKINANYLFIFSFQCSLYVCEPDRNANREAVRKFQLLMETSPPNHTCYYDPWFRSHGAVLTTHLPSVDVLYAVFFPAGSVFLGFIACIVFCRWCRAKEHLNTNDKVTSDTNKSIRLNLIEKQESGESIQLNNCRNKELPKLKLLERTWQSIMCFV